MLRTPLLHPQISEALARAGHSSKVLLADSNYPAATKLGPNARLVHLNVAPGLVNATDILRVLVEAIPIEAAEVMVPQDGPEPEIFAEFVRSSRMPRHSTATTSTSQRTTASPFTTWPKHPMSR
jgi:L-fucose mutarotase